MSIKNLQDDSLDNLHRSWSWLCKFRKYARAKLSKEERINKLAYEACPCTGCMFRHVCSAECPDFINYVRKK